MVIPSRRVSGESRKSLLSRVVSASTCCISCWTAGLLACFWTKFCRKLASRATREQPSVTHDLHWFDRFLDGTQVPAQRSEPVQRWISCKVAGVTPSLDLIITLERNV